MLGCLAGANIAIENDLAANLWPVNADPVNIEQVLMNLIINAIDAMPSGGRVTISTANRTLKSTALNAQRTPGQFVVLSITDTGSGMDAATREAIFEPFFTTKPQGQGTGLGLATAYGIVKQHEGWIEVESEPGCGSTFRIYLPACQEQVAEETARPVFSKIEPTSESRHILVVEDEPQVRELTVRCLKLYGYQVSEAADGQTALKLARQQDYDLVFSDVIMPGMTGLHLAEKLREYKPDCRIMLTSGHMDDKSQWPLIEQMGLPFLAKPFSVTSLIDGIGRALKPEQSC
jgi:CheY-like chemotaxis protein